MRQSTDTNTKINDNDTHQHLKTHKALSLPKRQKLYIFSKARKIEIALIEETNFTKTTTLQWQKIGMDYHSGGPNPPANTAIVAILFNKNLRGRTKNTINDDIGRISY